MGENDETAAKRHRELLTSLGRPKPIAADSQLNQLKRLKNIRDSSSSSRSSSSPPPPRSKSPAHDADNRPIFKNNNNNSRSNPNTPVNK